MIQSSLAIIIFILTTNMSVAQNFDLGSWNIFNLKYTVNDKWSVFGEAQLRSLEIYNNFHYFEYKAGTNYRLSKYITISLGAGSHQTYKEGGDFVLPKNSNEFRIWPQLIIFQSFGRLKLEQRYRAEFRLTSDDYRNRFRYRLGLAYPFGKEKKNYKPYQISVSNELFFTDSEPYFERNRMLMAFNHKPSKLTTFQIGYLHQFDYKINDEIGRDFLLIGLYIELFSKKNQKRDYEIQIKDN